MNPLEKIIAALKKKAAPAPKPAHTPAPVRQSFATQKQSIAPPMPMPAPAPQRQTVAQPRQVISTKVTKTAAKPNIVQKAVSNFKGNIKNFQDDDFKMYGPKVVGEQVTKLLSSKNKGPVKMQGDYLQDYVANAAGGLTEAGVGAVTIPRSKNATIMDKAGAYAGGIGSVMAPGRSVVIGTLTSAFKKALNRNKPVDLQGDIAAGAKTAGVLKATGPIVNKVLGKVSGSLPMNSLKATGATKAIQSGLNVAEGVAIDKATGMPTTPASIAIDAVTGAAGGPNIRAGKFTKAAENIDSNAVAKTLSEKDRLVSEAYSTVKNSLDTLNKPVKSIDEQLVRDNAEKVIRDVHQSIFKVPKKTQGEVSVQDMVDDIYHAYDTKVVPKLESSQGFSMGIKDSGTGISQMARETANQSAKDAGVAPIDSRQVNYTPLKESLINKNPTVRSTPEWGAEKSRLRNPKTAQNVASLSDTIVRSKDIDVKGKVNLVDYLRTPDRVLKKIGLEEESKLIRQKYDDYIRDLPKEIDKITAWSKQVSPESNRRIFQHLDGQKVTLDAKEAKVAGEVQAYLKEWADKLGLPEDGRIASYITHIFEKDFIQKEFDPELASLIRDKVPGSVYDPFLQERLGKQGYIEDTWRALDAYVKRATRKFHMDPALEKVSGKAEALEESQFNYVKSYVDRINMRPTKLDNLMDNTIKSIIGYKLGARPVAYASRVMRQAVYRGALGLNVGSALKNLTQGANTYAKLGEKYTAVGYTSLVKSILNGSKELEEVGVLRDDFVQDRTISATKQTLQKVDKVLFSLFEAAERINRGSAYFGAKAKGLSEGMGEKEAIEYARNVVRDTQFTFGSVDTPLLLQSDIGKTVAQFQSFTVKQTEFLAELAKNKDYAGLLRYTAGSLAMVYSVGQLFGMEMKDIIPAFRVGMPPILKAPKAIYDAVTGAPDQYGNVPDTQERLQNVGASLTPLIPGGVQAKKTLEGVGTVQQGFDTTKSGLVKYPVEQTPENYARAGLFGKYNLPESKGYEKSGYLREADSEAIKQLPPEEREAFYKEQLDERAMDKVVKEKNKQKQEAIDAYLDGDETKAAALQAKHGITVKQEDIKRRQTEYKNKAIDAYLDGAEDTAASIQGKYGLDVKQADITKRAKSRAITAYKRYLLTKNPKYEKQAADLQGKYGFQVKKEEIE